MAKVKKQYMVIGLSSFGSSLCKTLYENGADVLAIDRDIDAVNAIEPYSTQALCLDAADERALTKLGPNNFDACIVCLSSDLEANIYICLTLLQAGVKNIIAKARDRKHMVVLEKLGINRVVLPDEEMSRKIGLNLIRPNVIEIMALSDNFTIVEIKTPPKWVGKTIIELDVRNKEHINILAINRGNETIHDPYIGNTKLMADDILVISGSAVDTKRLHLKATKSVIE